MNFTDEELEKTLKEHMIEGQDNQDIVKRIHLMFGGDFTEKTTNYYNHVKFSFNGNLMLFVYDSHGYFIYKSPYRDSKAEYVNVNGWKLKKLIESIIEVFKVEKERTLHRKLAKIEGDF